MRPQILVAIEDFVNQSNTAVTIQSVANKFGRSWPSARVYLLRLASEGKIESEELSPRGLIFRSKKTKELIAEDPIKA